MVILSDELRYRLLKMIEANPTLSQREIANELGFSLGKVNYCLRALTARGWVKAQNFKNSRNKLAYFYLLTPKGLKEKGRVTFRFLKQRLEEIETLREEIAKLQSSVQAEKKEEEGDSADATIKA